MDIRLWAPAIDLIISTLDQHEFELFDVSEFSRSTLVCKTIWSLSFLLVQDLSLKSQNVWVL